MKKTNKILSLIMAMLIAIISVVYISAGDVIVNDEYIAFFENGIAADEFEEELMPLAANSCPTSANQMQKQVERGQVPSCVDRVGWCRY